MRVNHLRFDIGKESVWLERKGRRDQRHPLPKKLINALKLYLKSHSELTGDCYLFGPSGVKESSRAKHIERLFDKYRTKAGIEGKFILHGLRKWTTSRLAENGWTITNIMKITGHSDPSSIMPYVRMNAEGIRADYNEILEKEA
jgi:integrase